MRECHVDTTPGCLSVRPLSTTRQCHMDTMPGWLSVRLSVTYYKTLDFSSNFHEILSSKFLMKVSVPSASFVKIGALTPLLPSQPCFQVSRKPSVISTNAEVHWKSIKRNPSLHLKVYMKFCPYLTNFSSDCSGTSVTESAHKNLGVI
jgi:hypothetical protein